MGLKMMLKALGINISEEHIAQAESLIPQLPKILNEAIAVINSTIAKADVRITALETSNQKLIEQNTALMTNGVVLLEQLGDIRKRLIDDSERTDHAARNGGSGSGRKRTADHTGTN